MAADKDVKLMIVNLNLLLLQNMSGIGKIIKHKVLLVAAADSSEGLPPTIRRCFSHEISMGPLTEEQRIEMLTESLQSISELLPNVCGLPNDLIYFHWLIFV